MSAATPTTLSTAEQSAPAPATLPILRVPPVEIIFQPYRGPAETFTTSSSVTLFRRLATAAASAQRVVSLTARGATLDAESRAALNSYLRTNRIGRGAALPFGRLARGAACTRYQWASFTAYLDFTFVP